MSSFCKCKSYSHFFNKNISIYAIFNDQSFNDTLTNDLVSFEQLGHEYSLIWSFLYPLILQGADQGPNIEWADAKADLRFLLYFVMYIPAYLVTAFFFHHAS